MQLIYTINSSERDGSSIIKNPSVEIHPDIREKLATHTRELGQVIIHCLQRSKSDSAIRIWPTTFLYDQSSPHTSDLVHVENISYYPEWKSIGPGDHYFTLIFKGLPKTCRLFDLYEHCSNQAGAFRVLNIKRNKSDVYYVEV